MSLASSVLQTSVDAMTPVLAAAPVLAVTPVVPDYGEASACVRDNALFCGDWFVAQWATTFWPALAEHIALTVIAVGVGFILVFLGALLAHRHGWLVAPIGGVAAFLYTIPPLALFQLLIPVTGLSLLTVEIALISYTLATLFRSILAGLSGVPHDVRRAGEGMGLTRGQILRRIELPLAVPAIISSLRITAVLTVSVGTIAAFVVDFGLGSPILKAIQSPFNTQFIAAGALAIGLAFAIDGLLILAGRILAPWSYARSIA